MAWERKERWEPSPRLRLVSKNGKDVLEQEWTRVTYTKFGSCFSHKFRHVERRWHPVNDCGYGPTEY